MITFAEVKTFAEKRAAENGTVGECGLATRCLVAEAVLDKYPNVTHVRVGWTGEFDVDLGILTTEDADPDSLFDAGAAKWVGDHNDPEVAKLIALIKAFDRLKLPGEVLASVVLPLFEDEKPAQVDTGINEFEAYPDEEEEEDDDDLPFDEWDDDDDDDLGWDDEWDEEFDDEDEE